MKFFAYTLNLREDAAAIAAYKAIHQQVWPEVEAMQRSLGVTKVRIFLQGRRLFLYMEAEDRYDPVAAGRTYGSDPVVARWEEMMQTKFQERLPDAAPDQWWVLMEPIYVLDVQRQEH